MADKQEKIILAREYIIDGKLHKAGETVSVGPTTARNLIYRGTARPADAKKASAPAGDESKK